MTLSGNKRATAGQHRGRGGNTSSPRSKYIQLTINNFTDQEIYTLKEFIESTTSGAIWQKEIGKKNTVPHIHAHLEFKFAKRFSALKKIFPRAHIEEVKNRIESQKYCSKIFTKNGFKTRTEGPYFSGTLKKLKNKTIDIVHVLTDDQMRPWQKAITYLLKTEGDTDKINWIFDPKGGSGKTTLGKELCIRDPGVIYVTGKSSDIKCLIALQKEKLHIITHTVLFNIPRSANTIDYEALEEIKDGIFFSGKYVPGLYIVPFRLHILIFANFCPSPGAISDYKLDIWTINKDFELEVYNNKPQENPKFLDEGIP